MIQEELEREVYNLINSSPNDLTREETMELAGVLIDLVSQWLKEGLSREEIIRRIGVLREGKSEPWMDAM